MTLHDPAGSIPLTSEQAQWFRDTFAHLVANVERALVGKRRVIRLALTCLLSDGHMLLEDFPGTGKTLLAKSISNTVQGTNQRIQFTPDLLPSDLTGVNILDQRTNRFEFHRGPLFATVVLADEINRASPKTQAALLEVMEEGHVTIDGVAHPVGPPFMVMATQNPIEHAGTYRLPEAQLDRFLMKSSLGYPDHETTVALLGEASIRSRALAVEPLITAQGVNDMAVLAARVHVDRSILEYVSQLASASRSEESIRLGLSVRGALALVRAAKTWAAADGRPHVIPDDIRDLVQPVVAHRLLLDPDAEFSGVTVEEAVERVLTRVPPPVHRAA